MKIGLKIRNLRLNQRISLKDLAKKTGLTSSFLSQLERNITSPSVSSLEKIAFALNTKVGCFFEENGGRGIVFIKKGMGKKIIDKNNKIAFETLASGLLNIRMEPIIFNIGAGVEITKEFILFRGVEKFGMVLKGRIKLICDKEEMIFEEGDSIYCTNASLEQKIINIGRTKARFLWIVFRQR